jgi:pimeloyl-ACP methyl ester carboxylesterase
MEKRSGSRLANRKEAYRLWFEYLKLARLSTTREVKSALLVSGPFYAPWQIETAGKFDEWWKTHGHLFEEKYVVRELKQGETPLDPNALLVEIPLTKSPTDLTKAVKDLIQSAWDAQAKEHRKGKKKPSAFYHLSEGSEPKLLAVREMLTVYRDVYLKHPNLKGEKLLEQVHKYYEGRKNKRWAKIPTPLMMTAGRRDPDDLARAMRNLRRYIQKAELVVLNVARGKFPGPY